MAKEICISTTPHETRLAILEDDQLTEIYYERENEYTLAGSIYKGRVTRVLPGMQSAFVDIGLERDAFLYVTDFLEEQEDAADFEQVKPGGGNGQGSGQEGRRREPHPARQEGEPRTAVSEAPETAPEGPGESGDQDQEFEQGTRRWRGRRGRRRGFRREASPATESVTEERESSPDAQPGDLRPPQAAEDWLAPEMETPAPQRHDSTDRAVSPLILPGESLSRYGQSPAAAHEVEGPAAPSRPSVITSKPSTLVEHPIEWDGVSGLLPGESLSRYRRQQPAPEDEFPTIAAFETATPGRDVAIGAPEEEPAAFYHAEPDAAYQAITEAQAHADASAAANLGGSLSEAARQLDAAIPPAHPEADSSQAGHAGAEFQEELQAAASGLDLSPGASSSGEGSHAEVEAAPLAAEELAPAQSQASSIESSSASAEQLEEHEMEYEPEEASASHRIDSASPIAFRLPVEEEEHQERPEVVTEDDPGADADALAYAPAEAQAAEPSVASQTGSEPASLPEDSGEPSVHRLHAFTPGFGPVEEEVIEEEEFDFAPVYAQEDEHEFQELEEETLEQRGAAPEIGELIREAQIDRQVNAPVEDESEEGFEESESEEAEDEFEDEPADAVTTESPAQPRRDRQDRRRGGRNRPGRGRNGHGGRRQTAQMTDLPVISELLKQGQEILVQIAKEPIAKKGARITSHIALPGRFLVFMPTVNHVGVSRKIWSDEERQRLKRILISEKGQNSGGFIVRTAAEGASEEELRADLRFLINLWNGIKQRSESSKAPALIYHDLNLVERILRDQVSDNFSVIWVDSETEYERIVGFLNRFQPALVRRVKLYTKETPLFEQFGIQEEITKALKSKVWLKSGGSIVINQTEALVAIDINTGKYVGKTARLEDTILKTNLDAIPEIVRQIRLRDLGGIIVIDFIDMDERRNRHKVMQALEEALKADRAPSKVLQFNDFGLVAITRKRVKQSLERTLSVPCEVCAGTGMVKSPTTVCNEIYIEMRKMQKHFERHDVLLRVHPEVVKTLKASNGRWLNELEEMTGRTIIVKSDPALHPEQFDIH